MKRRFFGDEASFDLSVGRFRVRTHDGVVTDGTQVRRLEPQVMKLLVYLAQNAGRVVSRKELIREVWQGTQVSDGAVNRCVGVIRRFLTDNGTDPIRTVPKRGYQLVAPVLRNPGMDASSAGRRAIPVAVAVAVVLILGTIGGTGLLLGPGQARPVAIAVERFQELDVTARREAWGRSTTEELVARFEATPGFAVVLPDAEGRARPDVVVTGGVRREDDSVRLSCQLTDAKTRRVLCAGACTIPAGKRLQTQESAARHIASEARRVLSESAGP